MDRSIGSSRPRCSLQSYDGRCCRYDLVTGGGILFFLTLRERRVFLLVLAFALLLVSTRTLFAGLLRGRKYAYSDGGLQH